jgi:hypothetical protein
MGAEESQLRGLIAYELPIEEEDLTRLEIIIPAVAGNLATIGALFRNEMLAFHDALPPEEQVSDEHRGPIIRFVPAIIQLGNSGHIGPLWLPRAAKEKGMFIRDGRRLYEERVTAERQELAQRNLGDQSTGRLRKVTVFPKKKYL